MATLMGRNSNGYYSKMEREDPEERKHREAQFLIYKAMKQADQVVMMRRSSTRPNLLLRLRISKLKVRIGKRFLSLRKIMLSRISKTRGRVSKNVMGHLRSLKGLFSSTSNTVSYDSTVIATAIAVGRRRLPQPIFS